MCETVHSEKLAKKLNKELEKAGKTEKLKVLVQVNTSREESKFCLNEATILPGD